MMYTVNMNANRMIPRPRRMLDDPFFRSVMGMEPRPRTPGMRVDVRETDDAYILEAELPGVSPEEITLTTENDTLTIAAELRRRNARVERRFQLEGIRQEDIAADCENGLLTVTLPKEKPEGAKALRRIAIGAAASEPTPCLPEPTEA